MTLLLLSLVACTDKDVTGDDTSPIDDTAQSTPDPETVPLAGQCPAASDWGGFVVLNAPTEVGIDGKVTDAIWPQSELEQIGAEGDCRLMRRNNPYCDPSCDPGTTCNFEGECVAEPRNQDLGTVSVLGLGQAVEIEPVFPGYTYFDTSLAFPAYEPGGTLTLSMPGGTYGPVTLYGVGVEPLVTLDEVWTVEEGVDLTVTWEPPTGSVVRSEVDLFVNIDVHGASPGSVFCTFEDDGEGTVPASLIDQMVGAGVTGFPSGSVDRRTFDSTAIGDGCMDFHVSSAADVDVDVDGFTPCIDDEDCPDGQVCNKELQVCVDD